MTTLKKTVLAMAVVLGAFVAFGAANQAEAGYGFGYYGGYGYGGCYTPVYRTYYAPAYYAPVYGYGGYGCYGW